MMAARLTTAPTVELLRHANACGLSRYDLVGAVVHELTNDWPERWEGLVSLFAAIRAYDLETGVAGYGECEFDYEDHVVFDNVLEDANILDAFLKAGMRLNMEFTKPKFHSTDRYGIDVFDVWYWTLRSGADHVTKRYREAGYWYSLLSTVRPNSSFCSVIMLKSSLG
jgi:hypothetical protein